MIESYEFNETSRLERKNSLIKTLQKQIFKDIEILLNRADVDQIIVYIQNKQRLGDLIDKIRKYRGEFQQFKDYLEIHANISEIEKEEINRQKKLCENSFYDCFWE